jgi:hypothetical protein
MGGTVDRRAMLGALVRWTVPTVVTFTLGARILEAKASCPPCQTRQGGNCRACSVGTILACNCEPCLGPPYCAAVGPVAPAFPATQPTGQERNALADALRARRLAELQAGSTTFPDPFAGGARAAPAPSLFERLAPDTTAWRRP